MIKEINTEPKLSNQERIHVLAQKHILVDETDGHDEVKRKLIYYVDQHADEDSKCCVLEVSQLNVQGSEFHSPPNVSIC